MFSHWLLAGFVPLCPLSAIPFVDGFDHNHQRGGFSMGSLARPGIYVIANEGWAFLGEGCGVRCRLAICPLPSLSACICACNHTKHPLSTLACWGGSHYFSSPIPRHPMASSHPRPSTRGNKWKFRIRKNIVERRGRWKTGDFNKHPLKFDLFEKGTWTRYFESFKYLQHPRSARRPPF